MTNKAHILIVEDEAAIRTGLVDVFVYHGFQVDCAINGRQGYEMASGGGYDLVLLDVMLPGMDGFSVCAALRQVMPDQAIIMLTARDTDEDFITGLSLGADDYVAKPFSIAQLVLRVQAVLRRTRVAEPTHPELHFEQEGYVDLLNLSGQFHGQTVVFSRRETEVLAYLAQHSDRPVPREELLHKVWGYAPHLDIETRTVDIHVAKLRRKIEIDPKQPCHLVTVRGAGYRLILAVDAAGD